MKKAKKIMVTAICIAIMLSAVSAAASVAPGDLYEIYDTEPEKLTYLDPATLYGTTDVVTFDTPGLAYTRGVQGSSLDFDFAAAGRSGETGDLAAKMTANTDAAFGGINDLGTGGWDIFYDEGITTGYRATVGETAAENEPIVIEFDIKTDTNTDNYGFYCYRTWVDAGSDAYNIFGADGKIGGTDYEYQADKWYHFKWEIDGKKAYVYITPEGGAEELIVNGPWCIYGVDNTWRGAFFLQQTAKAAGAKRAGMTIDNWRHYSYKKSADGNIISPAGTTVPDDKNFVFRVSAEAAENDEIELCVDGDTVGSFDAETSDGKTMHDYAVDIDHCTVENGTHVLSAYRLSNGFREKIAEKIINVSALYAGILPMFMAYGDDDQNSYFERYSDVYLGTAQNTGYPIGVETFDDWATNGRETPYLFLASDLSQNAPYPCRGNGEGDGMSGQAGDKSYHVWHVSPNTSPENGLNILRSHAGTPMLTSGGLFEMEFDIKVASTEDAVSIYDMALWHNGGTWADGELKDRTFLLDNTGHVAGTDEEYKADTWMHFKLTYNVSENKWNVWKDLKHIVTDEPAKGQWDNKAEDWILLAGIETYDESVLPEFWLDNLSVRQYFNAPAVTEVSYSTPEDSDIPTGDLTIPDDTSAIMITLDQAFDAVAGSNIELFVNGTKTALSGVSYDSLFKMITVPVSGLSAGDKVDITVKDAKINGVCPGDIKTSLSVRSKEAYIAQTALNGNVLKVQIYKGKEATDAVLIAAVYDENTKTMTDVKIINTSFVTGESVYTFTFREAPMDKPVRIVAWRSLDDGLEPVLGKAELQ